MSTQRLKHTVIMRPYDESIGKSERDNRRIILSGIVNTIESHIQAGEWLRPNTTGYEITVLTTVDYACPLSNSDVLGWVFTVPVNSYYATATSKLFESLFHKNSMIDQYMIYSCELVDED